MKRAALGFRAHSGWSALVAVALDAGSPVLLFRGRPHLVTDFSYKFRQPYHTAEKQPPDEGRSFVLGVQAEARRLAYESIHAVQVELQGRGYELGHCGLLLASGRPLPELAHVLASHALIHAADGELFREALIHASTRLQLGVLTTKESAVMETASRVLRLAPDELVHRLAALGQHSGPPWSQDEKLAALVAWLSLVERQ